MRQLDFFSDWNDGSNNISRVTEETIVELTENLLLSLGSSPNGYLFTALSVALKTGFSEVAANTMETLGSLAPARIRSDLIQNIVSTTMNVHMHTQVVKGIHQMENDGRTYHYTLSLGGDTFHVYVIVTEVDVMLSNISGPGDRCVNLVDYSSPVLLAPPGVYENGHLSVNFSNRSENAVQALPAGRSPRDFMRRQRIASTPET